MAQITLGGNTVHTNGDAPKVGDTLPDFTLTTQSLEDVTLGSFKSKRVLNIFPSVETGVCAAAVREFNKRATNTPGVEVLNISADLPFALKRFCGAEGIEKAHTLSGFRSDVAEQLGLKMVDGGFAGLYARTVIVLDEKGQVVYVELVPEIGQEPNYDAAMASLG